MTETGLYKRKSSRLKGYDYSAPNAYFITICTMDRRNLFWKMEDDVGAASGRPNNARLTDCGKIVKQRIEEIPQHYPMISVDHYVIMPNHVHLLLQIHAEEFGRPVAAPTISVVVNKLKGAVSRQVGFTVWQKGFYDHVVRAEQDYREIWHYIENNPYKWKEDRFYQVE